MIEELLQVIERALIIKNITINTSSGDSQPFKKMGPAPIKFSSANVIYRKVINLDILFK
jgi:hypothetical protein